MSYYGSNYPTNSGPPPPPQYGGPQAAYPGAGGYGGGYPGGYPGGGYPGAPAPSAYNVNQYPGYGGPPGPRPGGQYAYNHNAYGGQSYGGAGAVPGFTVPGYSGPSAGAGYEAPPPQAPPPSVLYGQMQQRMSDVSMKQMQWNMYQQMGLLGEEEDEEEDKQRRERIARKHSRKAKKNLYVEEEDEEQEEPDEDMELEKRKMEERIQKAEEKARELQEKLQSNDALKIELREKFIDELMRRQVVSGTFEETHGTMFPFFKYDDGDPVAQWYLKERGASISGEEWDASYDSEYLRKAMRGLGTDEQAIIDVVTSRCNSQRHKMLLEYKTCFGRDLIKDLKSELSGDFKTSIIGMFETKARYDAYEIKRAIYGAGTDENALIEILMTRTNEQIKEMVEEYNKITYDQQKDPRSSAEKDIIEDTSGDFKRLLISATQGNRRLIDRSKLDDAVEEVIHNDIWTGMFSVNYEKLCNLEKCKRFAQELYKAGEKKLGTDEEVFNRIFSTQDYYTLRVVWDEYVKISQRDILNSVDRETSGDFKRALRAIAQNIKCRPMFFAERLYKAMKGLGTDDSTLIRIVISRSEIDMVQIKACFLEQYKQTLWNFIKDDTSGDYRKLLCAMVGKN